MPPIGDSISQHNVQCHQYADDMQLYVSLNPTDFGTLSDIESCARDVSRWFIENALLLNPTKTEAVFLPRDAMHPRYTSLRPVSVRHKSEFTKTAKRRITQTNTTLGLVFCCQRSPRNSTGIIPCGGAKCRWGGSKSATFDK